MFADNKYSRWYNLLIENAKHRSIYDDVYCEMHHIIPKSCGGSNKRENLVKLLPREHFLAHWLLTKCMIDSNHTNKMKFALQRMMYASERVERHTWCKWQYEVAKRHHSNICKTLIGEKNPMFGRKHSDEAKKAIGDANRGSRRSEETRSLMSERAKGKAKPKDFGSKVSDKLKGVSKSQDHIEALRLAQKNISKVECPHCGKSSSPGNASRWHFDRCKLAS